MKLEGYTLVESIRIWLAGIFLRGKLWKKMLNDKRLYEYIKNRHD